MHFFGYMKPLEWSGGMEYWSGVRNWTTGVGVAIFLKHAHNNHAHNNQNRDKLMIWQSQSRYVG